MREVIKLDAADVHAAEEFLQREIEEHRRTVEAMASNIGPDFAVTLQILARNASGVAAKTTIPIRVL